MHADLNLICVSLYQGGNVNRALHRADAGPLGTERRDDGTPGQKKFNPSVIERGLYFMGHDNGAAFYGKGSPEQPHSELAESWTAEIYSPPYLFIDGSRRTKINKISLVSAAEQGLSFIESIGNKNHYLLHSGMTIEMGLDGLPKEESCSNDRLGTLALVKLALVGTIHCTIYIDAAKLHLILYRFYSQEYPWMGQWSTAVRYPHRILGLCFRASDLYNTICRGTPNNSGILPSLLHGL